MRRPWLLINGLAAALAGSWAVYAQQQPAAQFKFTTSTELVLVNLVARDSKGNLVRNLNIDDVTVLEDGKPQHIVSFDIQNVDDANRTAEEAADAGLAGTVEKADITAANAAIAAGNATDATTEAATGGAGRGGRGRGGRGGRGGAPLSGDALYRDRRLVVLYFDLTTMEVEDVGHAIDSATDYIKKQMKPADMVAIASLGNTLQVNQDFTSDKDLLLKHLNALNPTLGDAFAAGGDGTTDGTADDGNSFTPDDTEFNIANVDRSLLALQTLADMLAHIQQKKSLLFFSGGITRVDNELTLRSAINSAVKANVSLYTMDARGLQALPPGGEARSASVRGTSNFSGRTQLNSLASNFNSQETIATLANDTGGKAFLDTNDFGPVYTQIQKDTEFYYLISYHSSNPARDGKYRKITVKVNRPDLKLSFRPGYYAPKDFNHLSTADKGGQLQEELDAAVPEQSLHLYATDGFLRLDAARYYVPVSLAIPGSEIPLTGFNPKAVPSVDIDGVVRDQLGRQIAHVTGTIKLDAKVTGGKQLQARNIQYDTGFVLAPGQKYQVKFAARENQTGEMGAYETVVEIPDFDKNETSLSISSVLIGSSLTAVKPNASNPLSADGAAVEPSVTHVFTPNQTMYMYYEIYDPKPDAQGMIKLKTNVVILRGKVRVYQTALTPTTEITDANRGAAVIQLAIPLDQLQPGYYTVQVNAIDENAGRVAFPRLPILIK